MDGHYPEENVSPNFIWWRNSSIFFLLFF
jgi:hypothetical protein